MQSFSERQSPPQVQPMARKARQAASPCAIVAGLERGRSPWYQGCRRRDAGWWSRAASVPGRLARCTTLIRDKTGTLTAGQPTVTDVALSDVGSPWSAIWPSR